MDLKHSRRGGGAYKLPIGSAGFALWSVQLFIPVSQQPAGHCLRPLEEIINIFFVQVSTGERTDIPGFLSQPPFSYVVWEGNFSSLSLSFFTCKIGIMIVQ